LVRFEVTPFMKLPSLFRGELTISTRLLLWFLAIALLPCLTLTAVIEYISSQALERSVRRGLMVIAENKAAAIDTYTLARRADAEVAGHLVVVVEATTRLGAVLEKDKLDSPAYEKESAPYRQVLSNYRDAYGYENVFLFSLNGKLLLRLHSDLDIGTNLKEGPLKDSELSDVFDRSKTLLQAVLSDFARYSGSSAPQGFIAHPIIDGDGVNIGVIVFQISDREIFRILGNYTGLGETGEAVVAQIKGDEVMVVAPTRFDPEAAFRRKARLGSSTMNGMQRASNGEHGYGPILDYRDLPCQASYSYIPSLRWGLVVKQDQSEAFAMVTSQRRAIGGLLLATVIVVVATAQLVARTLSRPVHEAVSVADRVSSGDLTAEVKLKARGEVGKLLAAIGKMTQDLRSLIGRIQKSSVALMSTATEIAATSKHQEQMVHDYGTSTNEAAAAVKEISATAQELLRTMTEVNEVASGTAELASHGQESLAGMDRTMHLLADSTTSIGSKLSVISERAANINLIVTTITKVADQTNLLSINAAIEAEKAGEYGLGFLVVAREIRRLADQTAVSTLDIERMVKEMQYSVSAGVMEMDKFSDQVRHGVREVASISEQLGKIITAVQRLNERFEQVTEGMSVQSQGAEQIREAVVHLSDGVNQTLDSLREFNQATVQLRESVGDLKDEVSRFRIDSAPT
jgi:methyl-accepting chemotaxis protein WspA